MKTDPKDKEMITVQEAAQLYSLSRRPFYNLLHQKGLNFLAFYFDGRRLIMRREFEKYLDKHPELRRRGYDGR